MPQDIEVVEAHLRGLAEGREENTQRMHAAEAAAAMAIQKEAAALVGNKLD